MPLKTSLLLLALAACSDSPAAPVPAPPSEASEPNEAAPEAASPEETPPPPAQSPREADRIRVVVTAPAELLRSEERLVDELVAALADANVDRDAATAEERQATEKLLAGEEEWEAPASWATHGVVLALAFDEPDMIGRRQQRRFSRGLRGAFILRGGDESPSYIQRSRLAQSERRGAVPAHLEVREGSGAFLARLALLARSDS